jgi:hypothetical protein
MHGIRKARTPSPRFAGLTGVLVAVIVAMAALSNNALLTTSLAVTATICGIAGTRFPTVSFALLVSLLYPAAGLAFLGQSGFFPGGQADPRYIPSAYGYQFVCLITVLGAYALCSITWLRLETPRTINGTIRLFRCKSQIIASLVILTYAPDWLGIRFGGPGAGGLNQLIQHVLAFRIFLISYYVFVTFSLYDRKTWLKCALLCLYVALPTSAVSGSGWSGTVILLAFVGSYLLTIDSVSSVDLIKRYPGVLSIALASLVFLVFFGLVWEGGLKESWRKDLRSGTVADGTVDRLTALSSHFQTTVDTLEGGKGVEALAARMSSGQGYFSLVISNKESGLFANEPGVFASTAFANLVPRLLWPDKPSLGGDSWMVRRFAGLNVAGDEQGASIGLGYVAQFFIEGGLIGVLLGSCFFGLLLAFSHAILRKVARSSVVGDLAFLAICLANFTTYDASYPKMINAITYQTLIFAVLLIVMRRRLRMRHALRFRSRWVAVRKQAPKSAKAEQAYG